jgi:methylthioribose-1-phosphate isomerase
MKVKPIEWQAGVVRLLDQTQLPEWVVIEEFSDWRGVAEAIRAMKVRGAPAIGIAAAYGITLAAHHFEGNQMEDFRSYMGEVFQEFARTRPTAVNLFGAIERMQRVVNTSTSVQEARERLLQEARQIEQEDYEADRRLAHHGALLLPPNARVLTSATRARWQQAASAPRWALSGSRGNKVGWRKPMYVKHAHACKACDSPPGSYSKRASRSSSSPIIWQAG